VHLKGLFDEGTIFLSIFADDQNVPHEPADRPARRRRLQVENGSTGGPKRLKLHLPETTELLSR